MAGLDNLSSVVNNGFCVGCGLCSYVDDKIGMTGTSSGTYEPDLSHDSYSIDSRATAICPFSDTSRNESILAKALFPDAPFDDDLIGKYYNVYAGWTIEKKFRENGSSGGLTSWLAAELLREKFIDSVIHLKATHNQPDLFEYSVSNSLEELQHGAKTKYYPSKLDSVLRESVLQKKKVMLIGVPCFIKAVQNLRLIDRAVAETIKYTASLVCGHLKTKHFANHLATCAKVDHTKMTNIDFRVPMTNEDAHTYGIKIKYINKAGRQEEKFAGPVNNFFGEDWGVGFFKLGSCDFCDDVAGETADITFGDAWIPPYESDSRGTNIVVVRNKQLNEILLKASTANLIALDHLEANDFVHSQAGSYRHRREGLAYRIKRYTAAGKPFPLKRVIPESVTLSKKDQKTYYLRHQLSLISHKAFAISMKLKSPLLFKILMTPMLTRYYANQSSWLQALIPKSIKQILKRMFSQTIRSRSKSTRAQYQKAHSIKN